MRERLSVAEAVRRLGISIPGYGEDCLMPPALWTRCPTCGRMTVFQGQPCGYCPQETSQEPKRFLRSARRLGRPRRAPPRRKSIG